MSQFRDESGKIIVKVGDVISWDTATGVHYEGVIIEIDGNKAVVTLLNKERIVVEL